MLAEAPNHANSPDALSAHEIRNAVSGISDSGTPLSSPQFVSPTTNTGKKQTDKAFSRLDILDQASFLFHNLNQPRFWPAFDYLAQNYAKIEGSDELRSNSGRKSDGEGNLDFAQLLLNTAKAYKNAFPLGFKFSNLTCH